MNELSLINADVMAGLRSLPDNHVQCVVTSPPYWALRDYGNPGQIGLEETPQEYIDKMVDVFKEVRRVLRDDGTAWVNMGDGYAGSGQGGDGGLKAKQLIGMPWRLALALQADGWWLRSDIIWHKPNPMPEGVSDRPTKSHEYIFLLTKAVKYYYDQDATREPSDYKSPSGSGAGRDRYDDNQRGACPSGGVDAHPSGRNKRTVWTIPTAPYHGAHYATFPPALPEVCIKAGTSEKGCCPECGSPFKRIIEPSPEYAKSLGKNSYSGDLKKGCQIKVRVLAEYVTTGWDPGCKHACEPIPCTVLDPFNGHGTTGLVAVRLRRDYIGIEINKTDCEATKARIEADNPLFNQVLIKRLAAPTVGRVNCA